MNQPAVSPARFARVAASGRAVRHVNLATLPGCGLGLVFALAAALPGGATENRAAALVDGNSAFAFELYRTLAARAPDENLVFSPYSVSTALALVYPGARGATATEMAAALHWTLPADELPSVFGALQRLLAEVEQRDSVTLRLANSLWCEQSHRFHPAYLAAVEQPFRAMIEQVNFREQSEAVRIRINGWVAEHTRDRIKDLLGPGALTSDSRLVLVNAVYLMARWAQPFEESATRPTPFHRPGAPPRDVMMMRQSKQVGFIETEQYAAIELPYAGQRLSLIALVPAAGRLAEVEQTLNTARMREIVTGLKSVKLALGLPRFKLAPEALSLAETLAKLGMPAAFDLQRADFTGLLAPDTHRGERLFISDVFHKAFVDVNEAGTEAAAATAVVIEATSAARPAPPREFIIDRPFLFMIRERQTGTLLFMGRVIDPP